MCIHLHIHIPNSFMKVYINTCYIYIHIDLSSIQYTGSRDLTVPPSPPSQCVTSRGGRDFLEGRRAAVNGRKSRWGMPRAPIVSSEVLVRVRYEFGWPNDWETVCWRCDVWMLHRKCETFVTLSNCLPLGEFSYRTTGEPPSYSARSSAAPRDAIRYVTSPSHTLLGACVCVSEREW